MWKPFNYNADGYKRIDKRVTVKHSPFIYNHFEVLKGLVTKSGLIRSLKQYYYNNDSASKFLNHLSFRASKLYHIRLNTDYLLAAIWVRRF